MTTGNTTNIFNFVSNRTLVSSGFAIAGLIYLYWGWLLSTGFGPQTEVTPIVERFGLAALLLVFSFGGFLARTKFENKSYWAVGLSAALATVGMALATAKLEQSILPHAGGGEVLVRMFITLVNSGLLAVTLVGVIEAFKWWASKNYPESTLTGSEPPQLGRKEAATTVAPLDTVSISVNVKSGTVEIKVDSMRISVSRADGG